MEPWNLQSKFSLRTASIVGFSLLAFIATTLLLYSQNAPAAPKKKKVIWEPTAVTQSVAQGTSNTTTVSITSDVDLSGTTVWVVPELAPYITVTPNQIVNDNGVRPLELSLNIAVSEVAPLGEIEGTIHIRKGKKTIAKPLPLSLDIIEGEDDGLPPDPGEAGKATLEGIDSDNDGVRDDIQRYIAITYPESEKTRAALTQQANNLQSLLLDAEDEQVTLINLNATLNDLECLIYIYDDDVQAAARTSRQLDATYLNTEERGRAYITAQDRARARSRRSLIGEQKKAACNFDLDVMEN